jgi:hypothetical protein
MLERLSGQTCATGGAGARAHGPNAGALSGQCPHHGSRPAALDARGRALVGDLGTGRASAHPSTIDACAIAHARTARERAALVRAGAGRPRLCRGVRARDRYWRIDYGRRVLRRGRGVGLGLVDAAVATVAARRQNQQEGPDARASHAAKPSQCPAPTPARRYASAPPN